MQTATPEPPLQSLGILFPPDFGPAAQAALNLPLRRFTEPGLYLIFDDGLTLALTRSFIDEMRTRYLRDPQLLPDAVRNAPQYAPCGVCPKRDVALMCHAIPTVFPFIEQVDRFLSYETATAIYCSHPSETGGGESILHFTRTTMQRALQHVSILSLMYYCEVGRSYFKYFKGILPLMDPMLVAERFYLNMFWDLGGSIPAVSALSRKMRTELETNVHCQVDRLRLFCRKDAFVNAFINTHVAVQFIHDDMEAILRKRSATEANPLTALPD